MILNVVEINLGDSMKKIIVGFVSLFLLSGAIAGPLVKFIKQASSENNSTQFRKHLQSCQKISGELNEALRIAAAKGLTGYVKEIMQTGKSAPGFDVNRVKVKTPFLWALTFGHLNTAQYMYNGCKTDAGQSLNLFIDSNYPKQTTLYKTAQSSRGESKALMLEWVLGLIKTTAQLESNAPLTVDAIDFFLSDSGAGMGSFFFQPEQQIEGSNNNSNNNSNNSVKKLYK